MTTNRANFLIVEDNDLDVEKITRSLEKLRIANPIARATNGEEALDMLLGTNGREKLPGPHLILLDINMPRMNGMEFLEELRRSKDLAKTPVFVITTSDRLADVEEAYRHDVCGYIVKPIAMQQIFETLSTLDLYWNLSQMSDNVS
ncbi:MAG: response regulator [Halioglobus sp.]